ncbi:SidA/IucD/PvdA family monooxygenase [Thalassococcus sp. BH17M4-6]|uniref:SidA/IucD/PvdA family monooxygenase n=1 Tax=Thalassococcus sp. BH17M4-6 TaxID=3413148 RepID=UPI003BEE702A
MRSVTTLPQLLCIGAGPGNLGLAALARSLTPGQIDIGIIERRHDLTWHQDQILPGTTLQNSWYRDLVMSADPTSHFTFANFLHRQGRFQRFLSSGITAPSRAEISQYFQWVGAELGVVETGTQCTSLRYDAASDRFEVGLKTGPLATTRTASHISVGTGTTINLFRDRNFAETDSIVYADALARSRRCRTAGRILVVGGGQSGAESFLHAITAAWDGDTPREVVWITRDSCFRGLDTGHFARDFFAAGFPQQFFNLSWAERQRLNAENVTAGRGISPGTLSRICETLYNGQLSSGPQVQTRLRPFTEMLELELRNDQPVATLRRGTEAAPEVEAFDLVILCLGHRQGAGAFAQDMLDLDDMALNPDYSVACETVPPGRVFLQSDATGSHGLSDTNFVAAPHRNAIILNSLLDHPHFDTQQDDLFAEFSPAVPPAPARGAACLSKFG